MHTDAASARLPAPHRAWWLAALSALAALLSLTGCNEAVSRDTLSPIADSGEISAWFYHLVFWVDAAVLAVVVTILVIAIVRFRKKPGDEALPPQSFGNMKLEIAWTIIPAIIVIGITVPTLGGIFELARKPDLNQKIIEVEVTGKQWWWEFDYAKEGINTANELHVEQGTQVVLNMTSADVIHSWWVPRIGGKRDANPGRRYPFYFRARTVGTFDGQCAELCGASHALMGTRVIVHPRSGPDSYQAWVAGQKLSAVKASTPQQEAGQKIFMTKGCVACHTIKGVSELAVGARSRTSGPNLTHVGSRTTIAARTLAMNAQNIARWVKNPQAVKQGALMTNLGLSDQEAADVAAYLVSLK